MTASPSNGLGVVSIAHRSPARDFIFSSISHGLYPEAVHMLTEIGSELLLQRQNQQQPSALARVPLKPSDVTFLSSLLVCPDTYLAGALAIDRSDGPRIARHSMILKRSVARLLISLSSYIDPSTLNNLFGQGLRDNRDGNNNPDGELSHEPFKRLTTTRARTERVNYYKPLPGFGGEDDDNDGDYYEDRTGRKRKRSRSRSRDSLSLRRGGRGRGRGSSNSRSKSRSTSRASSANRIGAQDVFEEQEYNEELEEQQQQQQQVGVDEDKQQHARDYSHPRRIDLWHRLGYLGFWNIVGHAFTGAPDNYYLELVSVYTEALERDFIFILSTKDHLKDVGQLLKETLMSYILRPSKLMRTNKEQSVFEYSIVKDALDAILADRSRQRDFPPLYQLRGNKPSENEEEIISIDKDIKSFEMATCGVRLRLLALIYQFLYIYSSFHEDNKDALTATPAETFLQDIAHELSKASYQQQLYFITPHANIEGPPPDESSSSESVGVHAFLSQFQILLGMKLLQPLARDPFRDLRIGNTWPLVAHSDEIQMLVSMQLSPFTLQTIDKIEFAIRLMTTVFRNWHLRRLLGRTDGQSGVEFDETQQFLNRLCLEARLQRKYAIAQAIHSDTVEKTLTHIQLLETGMELYLQ